MEERVKREDAETSRETRKTERERQRERPEGARKAQGTRAETKASGERGRVEQGTTGGENRKQSWWFDGSALQKQRGLASSCPRVRVWRAHPGDRTV